MMGRQKVDQSQLFYLFNLEGRIPARHLLRRINPTVTRILADVREKLEPFYSEIGRPSIDRERNVYVCPAGKLLKTKGNVGDDHALRYLASKRDCDACPLKP